MFGYRVPAPDEAMLISGGRRGASGSPFRVVVGHGAFVPPVFRKTRYLTLSMQEAEVEEQQASVRKQAEFARETSVVQAQYKAEVDKAQAEAAQAGPLAQANAQLAVIAAQADLAQQQ